MMRRIALAAIAVLLFEGCASGELRELAEGLDDLAQLTRAASSSSSSSRSSGDHRAATTSRESSGPGIGSSSGSGETRSARTRRNRSSGAGIGGSNQRSSEGRGIGASSRASRSASASSNSNIRVNRRVQALLHKAEGHLSSNRLTLPAGDNALETYQRVLELDSGNPQAREGIRRIADRYVELARGAISRQQWDKAETYLDKAERINPGLMAVRELRATVDERLRQAQSAAERERRRRELQAEAEREDRARRAARQAQEERERQERERREAAYQAEQERERRARAQQPPPQADAPAAAVGTPATKQDLQDCRANTMRMERVNLGGSGFQASDFANDCSELGFALDNIRRAGNRMTWEVEFEGVTVFCACQTP